jgi:hypothetical protein
LLLVGLVVSQLAARVRRRRVITVTDAGHLAAIHDAAEPARAKRSPSDVIDHVRSRLADVLNLRECRFEHGSLLGNEPRLMSDGTVLAGYGRWTADESLPAGEIKLRVYGSGRFYGRLVMRANPGEAPSLQARLVAFSVRRRRRSIVRRTQPQDNGRGCPPEHSRIRNPLEPRRDRRRLGGVSSVRCSLGLLGIHRDQSKVGQYNGVAQPQPPMCRGGRRGRN